MLDGRSICPTVRAQIWPTLESSLHPHWHCLVAICVGQLSIAVVKHLKSSTEKKGGLLPRIDLEVPDWLAPFVVQLIVRSCEEKAGRDLVQICPWRAHSQWHCWAGGGAFNTRTFGDACASHSALILLGGSQQVAPQPCDSTVINQLIFSQDICSPAVDTAKAQPRFLS